MIIWHIPYPTSFLLLKFSIWIPIYQTQLKMQTLGDTIGLKCIIKAWKINNSSSIVQLILSIRPNLASTTKCELEIDNKILKIFL